MLAPEFDKRGRTIAESRTLLVLRSLFVACCPRASGPGWNLGVRNVDGYRASVVFARCLAILRTPRTPTAVATVVTASKVVPAVPVSSTSKFESLSLYVFFRS